MTSKVQICNMALSRLGASTITSLTDGTESSKLCNTFFDTIAERVMMQGSWTSTIARRALAATTNIPAFTYNLEYQLPVNCLKVLQINEIVDGSIEYVIEGDKLLTDETSVAIKYISLLEDTEDWDPLLAEAVEIALASYLASPLTAQADVAEKLKEEYKIFLTNNLAIDGQQGTSFPYQSYDLIEDRF